MFVYPDWLIALLKAAIWASLLSIAITVVAKVLLS